MQSEVFESTIYNNTKEALSDQSLIGFIHFKSDYSTFFPLCNDDGFTSTAPNQHIEISVNIDSSIYKMFVEDQLLGVYNSFVKNISTSLSENEKLMKLPMDIIPLYGELKFGNRESLALPLFVGWVLVYIMILLVKTLKRESKAFNLMNIASCVKFLSGNTLDIFSLTF